MRIALIVPSSALINADAKYALFWKQFTDVQSRQRVWSMPHLGLLTIAALTDPGHELAYLDENHAPLDFGQAYDVVAISPVAHQAERAYEIAEAFRAGGAHVVLGGIHTTLLPEEAARHADTIFVGEGEGSWQAFLADFERGAPKPVYREPYPGSVDLCRSPVPRYDLVQPGAYKTMPVQATRGCPHHCEFCSTSELFGDKLRHKTVDQVKREIEAIRAVAPATFVFFADDNLLLKRSFARGLLEAMVPLNVRWHAFTDISAAKDAELLELARASGCTQLLIGFESLSPANLAGIDRRSWKLKQLPNYERAIETIQAHGIGVIGSFLVGLDEDGPDVFERIRDFVVNTNLYGVNITIQTPFPGTRLHARLAAERRITAPSWRYYTGFELTYAPKKMSAAELEDGYVWLCRELNSASLLERKLKHFKTIVRAHETV